MGDPLGEPADQPLPAEPVAEAVEIGQGDPRLLPVHPGNAAFAPDVPKGSLHPELDARTGTGALVEDKQEPGAGDIQGLRGPPLRPSLGIPPGWQPSGVAGVAAVAGGKGPSLGVEGTNEFGPAPRRLRGRLEPEVRGELLEGERGIGEQILQGLSDGRGTGYGEDGLLLVVQSCGGKGNQGPSTAKPSPFSAPRDRSATRSASPPSPAPSAPRPAERSWSRFA